MTSSNNSVYHYLFVWWIKGSSLPNRLAQILPPHLIQKKTQQEEGIIVCKVIPLTCRSRILNEGWGFQTSSFYLPCWWNGETQFTTSGKWWGTEGTWSHDGHSSLSVGTSPPPRVLRVGLPTMQWAASCSKAAAPEIFHLKPTDPIGSKYIKCVPAILFIC